MNKHSAKNSLFKKFIPFTLVLLTALGLAFAFLIVSMVTQNSGFWYAFTTILILLVPTTLIYCLVVSVAVIRNLKNK